MLHPFMLFNSLYFYPRPPRGGRRAVEVSAPNAQPISIHALREEGDLKIVSDMVTELISIHALREEGDTPKIIYEHGKIRFLSTPSARRATQLFDSHCPLHAISIHALREEGDWMPNITGPELEISIHALREEGDMMFALWMPTSCYFYPRPPRGGRPGVFVPQRDSAQKFLSTPSARRATRSLRWW